MTVFCTTQKEKNTPVRHIESLEKNGSKCFSLFFTKESKPMAKKEGDE
jgi:hypothetical protein